MSLELGEGTWGQFFMPFHISQLMANLIIGDYSTIIEKMAISVCSSQCAVNVTCYILNLHPTCLCSDKLNESILRIVIFLVTSTTEIEYFMASLERINDWP